MKTTDSDIVIVGSGVSGALIAYHLSKQGRKVTLLEAGSSVSRLKSLEQYYSSVPKFPECAYQEKPHAPFPKTLNDHYFTQNGPVPFKSTYLRVVGGTTWHWLGTCLRLLPDDFNMQSKFGRGVDWPISYDDLEPWYTKAEQELGVAGCHTEDLGSPRKQNYPMEEIPFSKLDEFVKQGLSGKPYSLMHTPQARNSIAYDNRSPCCYSASCVPICPVQAKYDATIHIKKAQTLGTELIENAVVFKLEVDSETGQITTALFKKPDGTIEQIKGKVFVLAANAIETTKILLMSKSNQFPNGLANTSDQVGRNLMDHPVTLSYAFAPVPIFPYNNPLSTSGFEELRNGNFRKEFAAYRIEVHNDGWTFPTGGLNPYVKELIEQGLTGSGLAQTYKDGVSKQICFAALTEQLPEEHNRVELDLNKFDAIGIPHPKITYALNSYEEKSFQESKNKMEEILKHLNCTSVRSVDTFFGAGHILGTHRMGNHAKTSVVNSDLQCHDHKNLFLVGGGCMPTAGTANPTLTIAALALKCGEHISQKYLERK